MHTILQMGVCICTSVIVLMLLCSEANAAPTNQRSGGVVNSTGQGGEQTQNNQTVGDSTSHNQQNGSQQAQAAPANQTSGGVGNSTDQGGRRTHSASINQQNGRQEPQAYRSHGQHRITEGQCDRYMVRYGYLGRRNRDAYHRRRSLMKFQSMAGLPQTGVLDDATSEMMSMPRCGNKDDDDDSSRKKRYAAISSWRKRVITYNFKSVSASVSALGRAQTHRIIRLAFNYWQNITPLTFRQIPDSQTADIEIIFGRGVHTSYYWDRESFDGPGGVLAHAFFPAGDRAPWSGDAHFDGAEPFTDRSNRGVNLLQVAVHEFGHSLGLGHSKDRNATMAPFYRGYVENFALHSDDIAGIQRLYGPNNRPNPPRPTVTPNPTDPPTNAPTAAPRPPPTVTPIPTDPPTNAPTATPRPPPNGGPCSDGRVDAIAAVRDGSYAVFAFRGNEYMLLNYNGIVNGYPRRLSEIAPLFDAVDAAIALSGNRIFLFRGNRVYLLYRNSNNRITSYRGPYALGSVIPGLPNNIDSIFTWSNNRIYAFKGNQYYRLSSQGGIDNGYPKPTNIWGPEFSRMDGIIRYDNDRTYIFKNGLYSRYNDQTSRIDAGYPKPVKVIWFGC